ncbi:hypothetical protein DBR43_17690 [Pedobacter sp. KBW06]|uniref:porin family protein n=1 Tax=Pedobacter sp. KBW06 TaxID=2153359 RepID=UPI000F5AD5CB|nr:porin family protein [Pedobacter sp. KBW06]RQO69885.1 hypothetical protein DBR43_17690 [Pedobacter sp. KBW06]
MKKISMVVLLGLFLANAGIAQTALRRAESDLEVLTENKESTEPGKLSFGLKAGYSRFTIAGAGVKEFSGGEQPSSLAGYYLGLELCTKLSRHWGFKHELSILQKGAVLKREEEGYPAFDSKYKNAYLDIAPFSLTFQLEGLQLFLGPYAGVLLSSSIQRKNESGEIYTDKSIFGDAKQTGNYTQKLDAGLLAGLGYEFKNGINIQAKYTQGLAPLIEHTERNEGQWKIYNRGFSVSLGYTLFGKR